jgi:hypothetical protein
MPQSALDMAFAFLSVAPSLVFSRIRERGLESFAEPSQHVVCHPPVLYPPSVFALADIAGVHNYQPLDRR